MVPLVTHWKQLLWDCYHHGRTFKKDDSEVKELLGNYLFLERPQDIHLPFNKKIDDVDSFNKYMMKGLYNLPGYMLKNDALLDYVNSIKDLNHIYCSDYEEREDLGLDTEPFIYTYPERLLHMLNLTFFDIKYPEAEYINQYNVMLKRLEKNPGSNRAVATLYSPGVDRYRTDIPCLNWLQFTIRNNKLEMHCMFRSNDLYGAWPSNMLFLTGIGLSMAEEFEDVKFNGIHYHSSSLHIYKTDIDAVKEILGE